MRVLPGIAVFTLALLAMAVGCSASAALGDGGAPTRTNLAIMSEMGGRLALMAAVTLGRGPDDSILVTVLPADGAWFLRSPAQDTLRAHGYAVTRDGVSPLTVTIIASDARTVYANPRRDGLFGVEVMDRLIRLSGEMRAARPGVTRTIPFEEEHRDTVSLREQQLIESSLIPSTRGTVPAGGLFSGFLEPLVLIGAVGIAVLLLFTVRS